MSSGRGGYSSHDPLVPNLDLSFLYHFLPYLGIFWLFLEIVFAVTLHLCIIPRLQRLTKPPPLSNNRDQLAFIKRVLGILDILETYDFKKFICGFMRNAKLEDIYHDNIMSFLSWATYSKKLIDCSADEVINLRLVLDSASQKHGHIFPPGFNPKVGHVSMTLDAISYLYRPLLLYVVNGFIEFLSTALLLRPIGFRSFQMRGMNYWYRSGSSKLPPVVFFHGITTGWSLYSAFIQNLVGEDRACILLDVDAIKIKSLNFHMVSPEELCLVTKNILRRHRFGRCSLFGHSFGTITAGFFFFSGLL